MAMGPLLNVNKTSNNNKVIFYINKLIEVRSETTKMDMAVVMLYGTEKCLGREGKGREEKRGLGS